MFVEYKDIDDVVTYEEMKVDYGIIDGLINNLEFIKILYYLQK